MILNASFDRGPVRAAMRCLVLLGWPLGCAGVFFAPPTRAWTDIQLYTYYFLMMFGALPVSEEVLVVCV